MGTNDRMFPMQGGPPIPWWLAEQIYAGYVTMFGSRQSLEKIAERGGFGWTEVEVMWNRSNAREAIIAAAKKGDAI